MIDFSSLMCCIAGHVPNEPEIVDYRVDGLVVVSSWCVRCGRDFLGLISAEDLRDESRRDEGPWGTVPCLFCRKDTLMTETAVPEMWPCSAVCPDCRDIWERIP